MKTGSTQHFQNEEKNTVSTSIEILDENNSTLGYAELTIKREVIGLIQKFDNAVKEMVKK